jgi:hypothetical protein
MRQASTLAFNLRVIREFPVLPNLCEPTVVSFRQYDWVCKHEGALLQLRHFLVGFQPPIGQFRCFLHQQLFATRRPFTYRFVKSCSTFQPCFLAPCVPFCISFIEPSPSFKCSIQTIATPAIPAEIAADSAAISCIEGGWGVSAKSILVG